MDYPFFGESWGRFPETQSNQRPRNNYYQNPPKSEKARAKKVVTIPVDFGDCENPKSKKAAAVDENTAAAKIQAAVRGFCVRKSRALNNLRIISKTRAEAAEVRRRMNDEHFVELIRGDDEKERVKIAEWIMSLLLRLDQIQGAIPYVRESRKAVVREVIRLQEIVDHIIARDCEMQDLENEGLSAEEKNGKGKTIEEMYVMVREESEELKRRVCELLKKSEEDDEMIYEMGVRLAQLEKHASHCADFTVRRASI